MLRHTLGFRRSALVLGAGLLTGVALTGCAGVQPTRTVTAAATNSAPDSTTDSTTASATSSSASSSEESTPPDSPLTAGLLSAADLGASDVHQFPLDGSGSADATDHPGPWGWGWGWGSGSGDAQVTPDACSTAAQNAMSGLPGLQDGVGQVARTDDVRTFEVLAVPKSPVDAVAELRSVMTACDGASITRSDGNGDGGSVTINTDELSGAPDHTAAFSVTVSGSHNDSTWSMTALVGAGDDGNRVLGLTQMSWGGQPDTAQFTDLLTHAYSVQADALD